MEEFSIHLYEKYLNKFGLNANFNKDDIKKQYHKIIKTSHPDKYYYDSDLYTYAQNLIKNYNNFYEYLEKYYDVYILAKSNKNSFYKNEHTNCKKQIDFRETLKDAFFKVLVIPAFGFILYFNFSFIANNKFLMKKIEPLPNVNINKTQIVIFDKLAKK